MSQRANKKTVDLVVDGKADLAGVQGETELEQHLHDGCRAREGVGNRDGGLICDDWRRVGEGVGIWHGIRIRRFVRSRRGVGATALVVAIGVGATTGAAASSVAALSE